MLVAPPSAILSGSRSSSVAVEGRSSVVVVTGAWFQVPWGYRRASVRSLIGKEPDIFLHPFERPPQVEVPQARPHVVAFQVRSHEPVHLFEPVAHLFRFTQFLGHLRYPLVCCRCLVSVHRQLQSSCGTFYATLSRSRGWQALVLACGMMRMQLKMWVLW